MGDAVQIEENPEKPIPTILVVDDEVLIRMPVCEFLRDCGFKVIEASTGDEAVTFIETIKDVDIVFSDVQMPGNINGFQLAAWVRSNRPDIEVILTSGVSHCSEQAKVLCEKDGPRFFGKPYIFGDLERHIRKLLTAAKQI